MLEPYEGAFGRAARHGHPVRRRRDAARGRGRGSTRCGFQVHQHALGDRAIRSALDAVEAARAAERLERPPAPHRAPPAARSRRRPAPAPRSAWSRTSSRTGPARSRDRGADEAARGGARRAPVPDRRPARSGAVLCFGSDWPVCTPNPLLEMEVAVTRQVARRRRMPSRSTRRSASTWRRRSPRSRAARAYVNHDDDAGVDRGREARRPRGARPQPVRPSAGADRRRERGDDRRRRPRRVRGLRGRGGVSSVAVRPLDGALSPSDRPGVPAAAVPPTIREAGMPWVRAVDGAAGS